MSIKITIIGAGYVGLVSGACFAQIGHDVICVDRERSKIERLNAGEMPIYEPGLDDLIAKNVAAGRLRFSTDVAPSVRGRDAVFIAVGTPTDGASGAADTRYVFAALKEICAAIDGFSVIVTKSTVPVGTNRQIVALANQALSSPASVAIASNPEFLREGAAIADFMKPDRIVVGSDDPRAVAIMRAIYAPIIGPTTPFVATGLETAELIKYAANAFLAIKVSFINEMADLCEAVGADVGDVAHGIGLDQRIGASFLKAGPGWGGSCFPKDTRALHSSAQAAAVSVRIVEAAIESNASRKKAMARRIIQACDGDLAGKRIAVLGVTFKGQTDDMRDSPSLEILPQLVSRGADVCAFDPSHPSEAQHLLPDVTLERTALDAVKNADALVVLADWTDFKALDLKALAAQMRRPLMIDMRNLFDRESALAAGFQKYIALGKGHAAPKAAG